MRFFFSPTLSPPHFPVFLFSLNFVVSDLRRLDGKRKIRTETIRLRDRVHMCLCVCCAGVVRQSRCQHVVSCKNIIRMHNSFIFIAVVYEKENIQSMCFCCACTLRSTHTFDRCAALSSQNYEDKFFREWNGWSGHQTKLSINFY